MPYSKRTTSLVAVLVSSALVTSSQAQPRLGADKYKSGSKMRALFAPVIKAAGKSTVAVNADGKQVALGTIITNDGWVLTKASELRGKEFTCKTQSGSSLDAEVVAYHRQWDVAMLKLSSKDAKPISLTPVRLAKDHKTQLGSWVVTPGIGSVPLSVGVYSVKAREIRRGRGEVGIGIEDAEGGIKINKIYENGAADKAGLKVGDLVFKVGEAAVKTRRELIAEIRKVTAGDRVVIFAKREAKEMSFLARLRHPAVSQVTRGAIQNRMGGKLSERRNGFSSIIQHDSVLQPAWCGGPLVNVKGEVIGMNIARGGRTESYAIPIDKLRSLINDLKAGKFPAPKQVNYWTGEAIEK